MHLVIDSQAGDQATLEVLVDNETAVENIKRFAAHSGYQAASREDGDDYCLTLTKK